MVLRRGEWGIGEGYRKVLLRYTTFKGGCFFRPRSFSYLPVTPLFTYIPPYIIPDSSTAPPSALTLRVLTIIRTPISPHPTCLLLPSTHHSSSCSWPVIIVLGNFLPQVIPDSSSTTPSPSAPSPNSTHHSSSCCCCRSLLKRGAMFTCLAAYAAGCYSGLLSTAR